MKRFACVAVVAGLLAVAGCPERRSPPGGAADGDGWVSLFDGQSLDGWKASENPSSFSVADGAIVASGRRAHLFYLGPVANHDFKNFELKMDAMTRLGSNGGIFFHTVWQSLGWPRTGYEVQVANTHADPRRSGSLYGVVDVPEAPAKDDEWFTSHITVRGRRIVVRVNGRTVVDYTEPPPAGGAGAGGPRLGRGTFALQAHDPGSTVYYRNIFVRPLPD